jgi:Na+(H+)/acetate symporter ActP
MIVAVAAGGGPNADLEPGGKAWVLMLVAVAFGIAQVVLLGICIGLRWRLGPPSTRGLVAGWLLGLAVSMFYLCGGFGP